MLRTARVPASSRWLCSAPRISALAANLRRYRTRRWGEPGRPIILTLWLSYPYLTHNSHLGISHFLIMQIFRSKAMNASD